MDHVEGDFLLGLWACRQPTKQSTTLIVKRGLDWLGETITCAFGEFATKAEKKTLRFPKERAREMTYVLAEAKIIALVEGDLWSLGQVDEGVRWVYIELRTQKLQRLHEAREVLRRCGFEWNWDLTDHHEIAPPIHDGRDADDDTPEYLRREAAEEGEGDSEPGPQDDEAEGPLGSTD